MKLLSSLKILTIHTLLLFAVIGTLSAQEVDFGDEIVEEPLPARLVGLNFNGLFPQGTFKRNLGEEKGFGVGAFLLYQSSPFSPHFLGFDIEYDNLYNESAVINGLEEVINSGYLSINFNWRIFPNVKLWKIEPYFEAYLGPNFIFTSTNLLDENGDSIEFNFNETNFGLEYGIGAGITIPFGDNWYFDAQFSRTQTSIARYLILPDANSSFREVNSANDHNKLKIGVVYSF